MERETRGFWESFARRSGGEVRRERGVLSFRTGLPMANYNGVIDAQLAPDEADARIDATIDAFAPLPLKWLVMPSTTPSDMSARLARAGFEARDSPVLMARPLDGLPALELPGDITLARVEDDAAFDAWVKLSFEEARASGDAHDCVWRAHRPLWKSADHAYFFAMRDGAPVARSMLRTTDGFAGLYGVWTAESARGRGLGRLVTLAALEEGRRRGLRESILQASALGLPVYRRLGFAEFGFMHVWEHNGRAARGASPSGDGARPG